MTVKEVPVIGDGSTCYRGDEHGWTSRCARSLLATSGESVPVVWLEQARLTLRNSATWGSHWKLSISNKEINWKMDDTGLAMDQENANPTIGYTLVQGNLWRIDVGLSENSTPNLRVLSSFSFFERPWIGGCIFRPNFSPKHAGSPIPLRGARGTYRVLHLEFVWGWGAKLLSVVHTSSMLRLATRCYHHCHQRVPTLRVPGDSPRNGHDSHDQWPVAEFRVTIVTHSGDLQQLSLENRSQERVPDSNQLQHSLTRQWPLVCWEVGKSMQSGGHGNPYCYCSF